MSEWGCPLRLLLTEDTCQRIKHLKRKLNSNYEPSKAEWEFLDRLARKLLKAKCSQREIRRLESEKLMMAIFSINGPQQKQDAQIRPLRQKLKEEALLRSQRYRTKFKCYERKRGRYQNTLEIRYGIWSTHIPLRFLP